MTETLYFQCLDKRADLLQPKQATPGSAAFDLYSLLRATIYPGESETIYTGWAVEIPKQHAGLVLPRSGLATKQGITPSNSPGLIDSDYRGEILVSLRNESRQVFEAEPGMRVAQLLIIPVPYMSVQVVDELTVTQRGEGGFGSTGA